jgi:hypothetical protein
MLVSIGDDIFHFMINLLLILWNLVHYNKADSIEQLLAILIIALFFFMQV